MKHEKIPTAIKIFEQEYSVGFDTQFCNKLEALGTSSSNLQQIKLASKWEKEKLPSDRIFRTFCHEVAHSLLWEMGEDKLSTNERFVDSLGNALCSFLEQNCDWKK